MVDVLICIGAVIFLCISGAIGHKIDPPKLTQKVCIESQYINQEVKDLKNLKGEKDESGCNAKAEVNTYIK